MGVGVPIEPLRGYLYNRDGTYGAPVELDTRGQLDRFMDVLARQAIDERREVRVTDGDDCLVFHSKDGRILWPNAEGVPPSGD